MSDPRRKEPPRDPGAYIGRLPERATETIPGGVGRRDRRVSGVATRPGPVRGPNPGPADDRTAPESHREGETANDDRLRQAGDAPPSAAPSPERP